MMRRHVHLQDIPTVLLRAFPACGGGPFACVDFGDSAEQFTVYITPDQALALATQAAEAVAAFRAAGVLPPATEAGAPEGEAAA